MSIFRTPLAISGVHDTTISVDGLGERGLCFGDSGGPIIWQPSEAYEPVVLGMEQWGDPVALESITSPEQIWSLIGWMRGFWLLRYRANLNVAPKRARRLLSVSTSKRFGAMDDLFGPTIARRLVRVALILPGAQERITTMGYL